jgi:hypothetical protein
MLAIKVTVPRISCSHAALTKYRASATLASVQLQGGLLVWRLGATNCMEEYGDVKRAFPSSLIRCVLLNTPIPKKRTAHDTEEAQLRQVNLDIKRR